MPLLRLLTGTLAVLTLGIVGVSQCSPPNAENVDARTGGAIPLAAEASILEEMAGELRLQDPAVCGGAPFLAFDAAPFGSFQLDPGVVGPGTVSFTVGLDSLTATEVGSNGVRGVDPMTGRPTALGAPPGASCMTGTEPDCWMPGQPTAINANAFDALCALSKGFFSVDEQTCPLTIWNSQNRADPTLPVSPTIAVALATILSGQDPTGANPFAGGSLFLLLSSLTPAGQDQVRSVTAGYPNPLGNPTPLLPLVVDPNDGPAAIHPDPVQSFFTANGLSPVLTDEQEALLGCGPFYGTNCDVHGVGQMRSEVSAVLQSWPLLEGAFEEYSWDLTDPSVDQPGTVGFAGEPVCARYQGSATSILPGCREPGDPGYDINVDGSTNGFDTLGSPGYQGQRVHPFTGQPWANEMAIFSWNLLEGMIAVSPSELDLDDPLRAEGCSFANPLECCSVAAALSHTTRAPEEDPSQPPLRRWLWESGAEYLVTEANGDLEDFLGWTLFAFGPEQSRVSGAEIGVPFLLSPPDPPPPIPNSPLIVTWQRLDGGYNFAGIAYGMVTDEDADGIPDAEDNCTQVQNGPLAGPNNQIDTDGDDYGNVCDCDFDQSLTCGIADFNLFLPDFQSTVDSGVGTDMDSSGTVGIDDFNLFLPGFVAGEPGPSGLVP